MAGRGGAEGRAADGPFCSNDVSNVLMRMDTDDGRASVSTAPDRSLQAKCSLTHRHPRIVIALLASFGLTAAALVLLACPFTQYHGSTVAGSAAGELVSASTEACSILETDFEYHTHASLKVLVDVDSAGTCCAECQRHPQCRVWIYGIVETLVGDGLQLLARNCHLRAFNGSERIKKIPRPGVASGRLEVKVAVTARNIGTSFKHPQRSNGRRHQQPNGSMRRSALAVDEEPQVIQKGLFEEVSEDNIEWQVVSPTAPVLLGPGIEKAISIGEKWMGEVLAGHRVGSQVHLTHDFGFVPVEDANGTAYLKQRTVRYRKILSGSCAESGMTPINDAKVCTAAAVALGYLDQHVTAYPGTEPRPEGCFLHAGQIWLSLADSNRGRGRLGSNWPICSSGSYPTTTSTTTTTTTSTTTTQNQTLWGYPSLFCFEVVQTSNFELSLARQQHVRRISVFACDESLIFSDGKEPQELGRNNDGLTISTVVVAPLTKHRQPDFLEIWSLLQQDGRALNHDWTAKVDPEAVFFPDRLRNQLKVHTHQQAWSLYVANCNKVNLPGLYNPLEIFSSAALRTFFHDGHKCQANLPGEMWAEANFMLHCMDMLGAGRVYADNLLSDERCTYSPCSDGMKAAYYKYSDASPTGAWFRCWHESTGDPLTKDKVANAASNGTASIETTGDGLPKDKVANAASNATTSNETTGDAPPKDKVAGAAASSTITSRGKV